jgi:hypothetical protein
VRTEHDVERVWLAADRGSTIPACAPRASTIVVWRRGFVVRHRSVARDEARALHALVEGARLVELCAAFAEPDERIEHVATRIFATLRQWLADGIVTRVSAE